MLRGDTPQGIGFFFIRMFMQEKGSPEIKAPTCRIALCYLLFDLCCATLLTQYAQSRVKHSSLSIPPSRALSLSVSLPPCLSASLSLSPSLYLSLSLSFFSLSLSFHLPEPAPLFIQLLLCVSFALSTIFLSCSNVHQIHLHNIISYTCIFYNSSVYAILSVSRFTNINKSRIATKTSYAFSKTMVASHP